MLPLIDIEQVNQKSVIKTSNAQNVSESEGGGFAEIFNFLSMDKNSKKSETKSKKTSQNSLEIPQELNKFSKNSSQQSNILKSLDEKYNLSKKFVESQKTESRNKNVKINISNNTQDTLPTKTTLKSARDLLEFSKTQTQEVKTLKDLNKVAEDLKLNIQKINLQKDNTNQEIKFKGVPKQEMLLDKQILKTNTANPKVTQKESKESLNILSNLLQDKELLNKESSKDSKASPNKTDFKAENKESLNVKNSTQNLKKEEKNLKDSQNVENLTPTKEKIESKTDFKTKEAENLEAKNKLQKTEIKNAQEKEKVKAKNIKESPDKPAESLQAKAQEPSKEIPKQEVGKQDFVVKNEIKQEEKVKEKTNQEEMLKESQNTKVASQSKATQESLRNPFALKEQAENLEAKNKLQKTEIKNA
ncbi:hypothetical protein, partial [Helicobacter ganmani]